VIRPKYYQPILYLLISAYIAGLIGLQWLPTRNLFQQLIPFNLLLSLSILLFFHRDYDRRTLLVFFSIAILGFVIEWIGVNSGRIFGVYWYETSLGFKIFNIPPIIGVNWLVLVYCSTDVANRLVNNQWLNAAIASSIMVMLDILIEPVAIFFKMWNWQDGVVPLQNYIAWWIISFFFCLLFNMTIKKTNNSMAPMLLLLQFIFFALHNVFFIWM
jgi:bisanhydrobacterioruberin hydratase